MCVVLNKRLVYNMIEKNLSLEAEDELRQGNGSPATEREGRADIETKVWSGRHTRLTLRLLHLQRRRQCIGDVDGALIGVSGVGAAFSA